MTVTPSSFPSRTFSSGVPDLTVRTSADRIHVVISVNSYGEIFNEYLYPVGGVVTIEELDVMMTPYARQMLVAPTTIVLTEERVDSSGTATSVSSLSLTTDVVYCQADVGTTAADFCSRFFLTLLRGEKRTAIGRLEYLHYVGTETASVTARYADGSSQTFQATRIGGNGYYSTLDVSPDRFVTEGKELVSYTVYAGSRQLTFIIDFEAADAAPILRFVNSFGCEELIYCAGKHEVSPEYRRQQARIGRNLRSYDIQETRTFKADTGVLTVAEQNWADDLFRSQEVTVFNIYNGVPTEGKEVVITSSKSEVTNEDDAQTRFTFDYQYAQRNHNVVQLQREGRIFDNTFDFTFN